MLLKYWLALAPVDWAAVTKHGALSCRDGRGAAAVDKGRPPVGWQTNTPPQQDTSTSGNSIVTYVRLG